MDLNKETGRCSISIAKDSVEVAHVEYGNFDVTAALSFDQDISVTLDRHSPQAIWWATMAADESHRLRLFQEGPYLRYMAHCRYYAKLALKGLGDKETLEAVKDYVVILFSKERGALAKSILYAVWYGSLVTEHQTATAVKKALDAMTDEQKRAARDSFEKTMYAWEAEQGVTYDDIMAVESEIVRNVEVLKTTAEQFKQRGVILSAFGGLKRAELAALGANHINGFHKDVSNKLGGQNGA